MTKRPPQINDRERALLSSLYQAYSGKMLYAALNILKNRQDAEDALMDTFVALSRNIYRLPVQPQKLCAYCVIAARNHALNVYNKRKQLHETQLREGISDERECDFIAEMESKDEANSTIAAIARLKEDYRDVLIYKYVYDLSVSEIADLLGRNRNSVKSALKRGKAKLLELLSQGER